ncbi:chorismate mutase [Streptomyces sp. INA 01156]
MHTHQESTVTLEELRSDLDEIDARFLEVIRERIQKCVDIGHFKREHNVPMMQPHRIGVVQERAARFGELHGVDRNSSAGSTTWSSRRPAGWRTR